MSCMSAITKYNPRSRINAPQHLEDYEAFSNDPDPFSLNSEMATIRTLQVEMRQAIEGKNRESRLEFYTEMAMGLAKFLHEEEGWGAQFTVPEEKFDYIRKLSRRLLVIVKNQFEAKFGTDNTITLQQAKAMSHLIETGAKIAEKQRTMLEKAKTQVRWDDQLLNTLVMFVSQCVIPNVSNIQERAAIAAATKLWLPSAAGR